MTDSLYNFDDDNIEQVGEDSFIVIDQYDGYYHIDHTDTIIDNQHVVIDTFKSKDTVYVEKTLFDQELKIIEKLIDRPDFGKGLCSILVLIFVAYAILKKWKCKKNE